MRKPLVAIFGCGPSGLLAAYACEAYDVPFAIFSQLKKSKLGGAQYSHKAIPGLTSEDPETMIVYRVDGDDETYQQKVYGGAPVPFVSFSNVSDGKQVPAWNLRGLYDRLWEKYHDRIVEVGIGQAEAARIPLAFNISFSSIPAPAICLSGMAHSFRSQPVRIFNQALVEDLPDNTIWYEGTRDHSWYRMSKLFGVGSTEWGASAPLPPVGEIITVNKPVETNCDCHPYLNRIGRFGTWSKGVLTFHAYDSVVECLTEMGIV